eukprot:TRINITY_DN2902_c0_g1_i2.p1 TRINITY_DN2902_c0_g1~~TRINITY_DN2902_c0_g1_i2.p1  ORF type:complete len:493 (-),score=117.27 TRINITY_DN2902_c0_g1_i2:34-1512(-)
MPEIQRTKNPSETMRTKNHDAETSDQDGEKHVTAATGEPPVSPTRSPSTIRKPGSTISPPALVSKITTQPKQSKPVGTVKVGAGNTKSLAQKFQQSDAGPERKEDPELKRTHIVKEIQFTEKNYLNVLRNVVEEFLNPLYTADILSPELISTVFGPMESLYEYHQGFLKSLSSRVEAWGPSQKIGDLFLDKTDFLVIYSEYANNFNTAMYTLAEQKEKNRLFANFVKTVEQNPMVKMQDLGSLLIEPIQRIPRYQMLLKDLLKNTTPSHPDQANITKALEKIETIASYINEEKRKAENKEAIDCLNDRLAVKYEEGWNKAGDKPTTSLEDQYLKDGQLLVAKWTSNGVKDNAVKSLKQIVLLKESVVLFSGKSGKLVPKHSFSLEALQPPTDIHEIKQWVLFQCTEGKHSFQVSAPSLAEYRAWSVLLRNTIKIFKTSVTMTGPDSLMKQMESVHSSILEGILDSTISHSHTKRKVTDVRDMFFGPPQGETE